MGPALLRCIEMSCRAPSGLGRGAGSPRLPGDKPLSSEVTSIAVHRLPADSVFYLDGGLWVLFCFFNCPQIRKKQERLCPNGGHHPGTQSQLPAGTPLLLQAALLPSSLSSCRLCDFSDASILKCQRGHICPLTSPPLFCI